MGWASITKPSDSYIPKIHYRRGKRSVVVLLDMIAGSSLPPSYSLLPAFKYQSSSELSSVVVHSSTSSIFAEPPAE